MCNFLQVFLFNHSQILVQFFFSRFNFIYEQNVFLVNKKCSLGDRLGELYCSERLLDQLCWVMIILVNGSVLLLNFCVQQPIVGNITFALRSFFSISPFHAKFCFQRVFSFFARAYILISNQESSY